MPGDIFDSHVPGQLQGLAGKSLGIAPPLLGKLNLHLAQGATEPTEYPLHPEVNPNWGFPNRFSPETPFHLPTPNYFTGATHGTTEFLRFLANLKNHSAALICGVDILRAANVKGMV